MLKRLLMTMTLTVLLMLAQPVFAQDIFSSTWRAQYYNNPYLAGTPNLERFDSRVGFDWGIEAPDSAVPADMFSVRWGKGGWLPAGTYRFIITADEGFRLYVDGRTILDSWDTPQPGVTLGTDVFLEAGEHRIQIDYREFRDLAYIYLDWGLAPGGQAQPQPTAVNYGTVTVTTALLNVRSEPRIANNIIARIQQGQQFREVTRSEDGRWMQLDLGSGTSGWVSTAYVVPSTASASSLTGNVLQANARLLVRSLPGSEGEAIGLLIPQEVVPIVGRSADLTWWQINDNGRIGWVSAAYVTLSPTVNPASIPVAQ